MDKLEKFGQFGNYHFWFPVFTTEYTVPLFTAKMEIGLKANKDVMLSLKTDLLLANDFALPTK